MNTYADKTQKNKNQSVANSVSQEQNGSESTFQFVDKRPEAIAQQKLQKMANNSQKVKQLRAVQTVADNSPQANMNMVQRKSGGGEKYNTELSEIINSLKTLQGSEEVKSDPEVFEAIAYYIEKATDVLKGDDTQAKEALIENAKNGSSSTHEGEKTNATAPDLQMKATRSMPVQRVIGLAIGLTVAVGIGYGIFRIMRNRGRMATLPPGIQDIPTTRAGFGQTLRLGGLTTGELTNEEIGAQVRSRTSHNHDILYQQLIEDGNVTDIAQLVQGVRDDEGLCVGALCHDLTRFLIQKRIGRRPTIDDLQELTGENEILYDLNSEDSLEARLKGCLPGTSVYLGSTEAMSGHTFTVVGENRGRVIVADRQPANPIAALKYASTVEAEARLSRNLNPDQQDAIDREFSGRLILNQFHA